MSRIQRIEKQTDNRFLNLYELQAVRRSGRVSPYYVASRATDSTQLKAVTGVNKPDGVILYGVYGDKKDRVVLVRQFRPPAGRRMLEFPAGFSVRIDLFHVPERNDSRKKRVPGKKELYPIFSQLTFPEFCTIVRTVFSSACQ